MKKFEIAISYTGSIIVNLEAESRAGAIEKAREKVNNKPNEEFLEELEPQYCGCEVLDEWNIVKVNKYTGGKK